MILVQTRLNQFLAEKKTSKIYRVAKGASVTKKSFMRDRRLGMHRSDAKNYNHHRTHVVIPLTRQLADAVMFISLGLQETTSRFDSARLRKQPTFCDKATCVPAK